MIYILLQRHDSASVYRCYTYSTHKRDEFGSLVRSSNFAWSRIEAVLTASGRSNSKIHANSNSKASSTTLHSTAWLESDEHGWPREHTRVLNVHMRVSQHPWLNWRQATCGSQFSRDIYLSTDLYCTCTLIVWSFDSPWHSSNLKPILAVNYSWWLLLGKIHRNAWYK